MELYLHMDKQVQERRTLWRVMITYLKIRNQMFMCQILIHQMTKI